MANHGVARETDEAALHGTPQESRHIINAAPCTIITNTHHINFEAGKLVKRTIDGAYITHTDVYKAARRADHVKKGVLDAPRQVSEVCQHVNHHGSASINHGVKITREVGRRISMRHGQGLDCEDARGGDDRNIIEADKDTPIKQEELKDNSNPMMVIDSAEKHVAKENKQPDGATATRRTSAHTKLGDQDRNKNEVEDKTNDSDVEGTKCTVRSDDGTKEEKETWAYFNYPLHSFLTNHEQHPNVSEDNKDRPVTIVWSHEIDEEDEWSTGSHQREIHDAPNQTAKMCTTRHQHAYDVPGIHIMGKGHAAHPNRESLDTSMANKIMLNGTLDNEQATRHSEHPHLTFFTLDVNNDDHALATTTEVDRKNKRNNRSTQVSTSENNLRSYFIDKDVRYRLTQTEKISKLNFDNTAASFVSNRALAQYIGVNVRPDVCAPVQLIAPGLEPPTKEEMKLLRKIIDFLKDTSGQGLDYVKVDMDTARIVLLTDASFANARDLKSQLGYLILVVDDDGNCNVLHYGSNRCRRVARSVMAAELFALVLGYDYAYVVRTLMEEMTGLNLKMEALVDSKTVFDVIAKYSQTGEKRLQIDVNALRQEYDYGELHRLGWLPCILNAADPLTKHRLSLTSPLYLIMVTNRFAVKPCGWAASHKPEVPGVSNPI